MSKLKNSLKNQTEDSAKNKGGISGKSVIDLSSFKDTTDLFFKPQLGKNLIDIIPFQVTTKNHPTVKKGEYAYVLPMYVHRNVNIKGDSFLCLAKHSGQPCPICEEKAKIEQQGASKEEIDKLTAKRRVLYNVIDLNSDAKKPKVQLFETSHFGFEKEIVTLAEEDGDGEVIVFADPEEGKSISFKGREETFKGKKFTAIKNLSFEDRDDQYDEAIIEKAHPLDALLSTSTYEEMQNAFFNGVSDSDDDEDDDDEKPAKKKTSKKKDTIEDNEDEDEDEKPVKKSSKKDDEDDDEEDDEEDEEDEDEDEKPVKKSSKKEEAKPDKKAKKDVSGCPAGHIFGDDIDEYDDCDDCAEYSKCKKASK